MRLSVLFLGAIVTVSACSSTENSGLPGSYVATIFRVAPPGQGTKDVLAAGGSLTITIASNNSTTGSINIPASVTGGAAFVADMELLSKGVEIGGRR